MNILQINASARREGANSTKLADQITGRLKASHPEATLTVRDLATTPVTVLDEAALGALFTPAEQRSAEQAAVEIGRASCRERVEISGVAGAVENENDDSGRVGHH